MECNAVDEWIDVRFLVILARCRCGLFMWFPMLLLALLLMSRLPLFASVPSLPPSLPALTLLQLLLCFSSLALPPVGLKSCALEIINQSVNQT